MSERVVLINRERGRMFIANMAHEIYCAQAGLCGCQWQTLQLNPDTKNKGKVRVEKKVRTPASFTILPLQKSRPLHPAVKEIPEVKTALAERRLMVKPLED